MVEIKSHRGLGTSNNKKITLRLRIQTGVNLNPQRPKWMTGYWAVNSRADDGRLAICPLYVWVPASQLTLALWETALFWERPSERSWGTIQPKHSFTQFKQFPQVWEWSSLLQSFGYTCAFKCAVSLLQTDSLTSGMCWEWRRAVVSTHANSVGMSERGKWCSFELHISAPH